MEYINMLRDPSDKAQPSVFRFDTYPGQNVFSCSANPQESKYINSLHVQNPPMLSNFIPQQPVLSPLAPQVPSSFSFRSPANQVSFSGHFPFHTSSPGLVDHSNPGFSDQRLRLILGKRKTDPDADILQPCKQHITEEKMAEHMSKLHISSETVTSPLEPESVKNKRLYMCEEMRKLQTEPILPASLVAHIQQPCTALVLWQPPAKVLPVLGTKSDDDSSKEDESIRDADESSKAGVLESVDMDGELGGMDLDS